MTHSWVGVYGGLYTGGLNTGYNGTQLGVGVHLRL